MNNLTELETLVNKWQATGLLEGLSVWHQIKLAQLLNDGAKLLVKRAENNLHNELLAGLVLPAISRKFRFVHQTDFSVEALIQQLERQLPTLQFRSDKLKDIFPNTWKKYEHELETEFLNELFEV